VELGRTTSVPTAAERTASALERIANVLEGRHAQGVIHWSRETVKAQDGGDVVAYNYAFDKLREQLNVLAR